MEADVSGEDFRVNSQQILKLFIAVYKSSPELWDPTNVNYTNRYRRLEAQDKLLTIYRKIHRDASRTDLRKKINTLRSNYNKEIGKIKTAEANGREYVPRNWLFHELRFLDLIKKPEAQVESTENEESSDAVNDKEIKTEKSLSLHPTATLIGIVQNQDILMDKQNNKRTPVILKPKPISSLMNRKQIIQPRKKFNEHLCPRVCPTTTSSSFSCSGIEPIALVWSSKLQSLLPTQRLLAEKVINDILFEASLNNLDKGALVINPGISSVSSTEAEGFGVDMTEEYVEYGTTDEDQ